MNELEKLINELFILVKLEARFFEEKGYARYIDIQKQIYQIIKDKKKRIF